MGPGAAVVLGSTRSETAAVFGGGGGVRAGITGTVGAMVLTIGVTPGVGTAAAELTPRLLISVEPSAMPVRGTPPAVVGDVDAFMLPDPPPHMLDMPDVSINADVGAMPDDVDITGIADAPGIDIELCGVTFPTTTPPPSKVLVDPNIVDGAEPMVEHAALPRAPAGEAGAGLTPGDAISVAPSGMPVPVTCVLGTMPSGEVAESKGVGITAACCAKAGLPRRAEAVVIIRKRFMVFSGAAAKDGKG